MRAVNARPVADCEIVVLLPTPGQASLCDIGPQREVAYSLTPKGLFADLIGFVPPQAADVIFEML